MIGILDYGAGNLTSVRLAFGRLGVEASLVRDASEWQSGMTHLVFPGVGSAASGMAGVRERGFDALMRDWLSRGLPALAICLGEQLIFGSSEEDGGVSGLGLVSGRVVPFSFPAESHVKVPHMGWNGVSFPMAHPVLAGLADGEAFYFVHSYYAAPVHVDGGSWQPVRDAVPSGAERRGRSAPAAELCGLGWARRVRS